MATLSSHLLDSTNGTHASGVKVLIYQINSNGEKKSLEVELFPWEKLNFVDTIKEKFNL